MTLSIRRVVSLSLFALALLAASKAAQALPPTPRLLGSAATPGALTTDGANLYIGSGNNVLAMPITGGPSTTLYPAAAPCCVVGITNAGGALFWIDPNGDPDATAIFAGPAAGGMIMKVYSGFATGQPIVDGIGIASDGAHLYAADAVDGNVVSMNLDGSGIVTLGSRYGGFFSTEHSNRIAVSGGVLYIADEGCACTGGFETPQIVSIPAGGGTFTTLFTSPTVRPHDIAVIGGVLYFTDSINNTIWQMPTTGGAATAFIAGAPFTQVSGITALGTSLYVTDAAAGTVYQIATASPPPVPALPARGVVALAGAALVGGLLVLRRRSGARVARHVP
jgi:hypothetical protein